MSKELEILAKKIIGNLTIFTEETDCPDIIIHYRIYGNDENECIEVTKEQFELLNEWLSK